MIPRLSNSPIASFRSDGSCLDLAAPDVCEIDFVWIAGRLSRLARFNGVPEAGIYSVAQHCVMGTEALLNEGADQTTAALFLLHDGHEALIGDMVRPMQSLLARMIETENPKAAAIFSRTLHRVKDGWDAAIYAAADLPPPSRWTNSQKTLVSKMDERMAAAEARALLGYRANDTYPVDFYPKPRTRGEIKPWGCVKAEAAFMACFTRLLGEERIYDARSIHGAHISAAGAL